MVKTKNIELELAQQEVGLLHQQLSWFGAPPIPEWEKESDPEEDLEADEDEQFPTEE